MNTKQKIVFLITKATSGGAQRYVYDLATHLPAETFIPIVAFGQSGKLVDKLSASHIETHRIRSMGRDVAVLSDVLSFFQIVLYLWHTKPDTLHLNSSKAAAIGAFAARMMRVPTIIFTAHGWPFKEDRGLLARGIIYLISWLTALLSHAVIVVSKSDEELGKRMWRVGSKIHYIPIGIDDPDFLDRDAALEFLRAKMPAVQTGTGTPRIMSIAELTLNKGIRYAIEAISQLKERGVHVVYIVIGDGEERSHLKSLARAKNVEDRVFFIGFLENAARYLKAADVFLLPSIKEGMPYVLLEAAAARLPIVTTTAINPDVIAAYGDIRAVTPGDARALAQGLSEAILARAEQELFPSSNFPLRTMCTDTIALYTRRN